MQYLSEEWVEAAGTALEEAWRHPVGDGPSGASEPASPLTVAWEVTGAPGGKVTYHMWLGPDGAGMATGEPADGADAGMALDYDTAVAIARGEVSAQAAFMQGRLKLGGDVTVLIRGAGALAALGDALGALRGTTEF